MKRCLFLFGLSVFLISCATPVVEQNAPQSAASSIDRIVQEYGSWVPLFESPRNVAAFLMALCRTVNAEEQAYLNSEHSEFYVQVFVNPIGANTMIQEGKRVFPEGSVIVKEKWMQDARFANSKIMPERGGLGIMVKHAAGFNVQSRDWEYLYVDENGAVTRDQNELEYCRACHAGSQERDSVFYPEVLSQ